MQKFPMGFWNYTRAGQLGKDAVQDWIDLGMTFAMSPSFDPESDNKQHIIDLLDECQAKGMKMILCDKRSSWTGASTNPAAYEAQFKAAFEDFGRHPATFGFHIGDEPINETQFNDCVEAGRIQRKVAPNLTPFLNYLPYWKGIEEGILKTTDPFETWLAKISRKGEQKLICYDHYAQMNPEEAGTEGYFTNLRKFMTGAKEAGLPLWTTLLSVGHFRYRCPKEDDFRWQLSTAVACGCKGILWFFIYMRQPTSNYRIAPIDEFWERTETFEWLSRVNRRFLRQFGDFFHNATHLDTHMIGKAYGGYPLLEGELSPLVKAVTCDHGLPGVVSRFRRDGKEYVCLVNNSVKESGLFKCHLPKTVKVIERLDWGGPTDVKTHHWDGHYREGENEITCGDWLAPGEMKLYRFE